MENTKVTSNNILQLCSIESGSYTASLQGRYNRDAETWTYQAAVHRGETVLFEPMLRHEVDGVQRIFQERGVEWLGVKLLSRGLAPPMVAAEEVRDFENALKVSQNLIGHFVERGHEIALQDLAITDDLVLQSKPQQQKASRTFTRGR